MAYLFELLFYPCTARGGHKLVPGVENGFQRRDVVCQTENSYNMGMQMTMTVEELMEGFRNLDSQITRNCKYIQKYVLCMKLFYCGKVGDAGL